MDNQHDWELSKENAAPLEFGRSTKSLCKRAFGTSTAEMALVEEKTKKYDKLVRRCEKAVEWLQKQSAKILEQRRSSSDDGGGDDQLTEEEAQSLRDKLVKDLGFDPHTTDRENIDYDPMRYWVLYIKHIRESYPSDSQRQFLLMERCARTFMARPFLFPSYQNDVRFIRTCILYADKTSNPSEVFKLMSKIKVGTKVSLFWVAWAWVAEKAQDFQFTERIFQKALSVGAEPRKFLEERQRQFLRRMSRHWLNASQAQEDGVNDDGEEEEGGEDGGRGALNALSSAGVARNDRRQQDHQGGATLLISSRSGQQQQGRKENNPSVGFNIFHDGDENACDVLNDDDDNAPGGRQRLARESERTKENNMRPEMWNERGGLVNPATTSAAAAAAAAPIGADSIVGTVRDSAPASFGRPPPAGGHHRSASGPAFDVFVDEEFNADENEEDTGNEERRTADQRSLRQRLDGGTADRLTRDPLRYMKNPSKIESDQVKYDVPVAEEREEKVKQPEPKDSKTRSSGFDKQLLKEDSSGHECCFEERRASARYYKLVSSDDNINLLKNGANDHQNTSSQMEISESLTGEVEESIDEVDMEQTEEIILKQPAKSVLKSSLRNRNTAGKMSEEDNPRRVLFGANTNVVFTNASTNTSTTSSQPDGSFVKVEETINTKLANAEISMMFSSPNNASLAETPAGKSLLSSSFNQPLFSMNSKKKAGSSSFAIHDENKLESTGGLNFSIHEEDETKPVVAKKSFGFAIMDENKQADGDSGEDTANLSVIGDVMNDLGVKSRSTRSNDTRGRQSQKIESAAVEDTASLSVIGDVMDSLQNCSVNGNTQKARSGFAIYSDDEKPAKPPAIFADEDAPKKKQKIDEPCFGDISVIDDEKTSHFQMDENVVASASTAIDYTSQHKMDMESALRTCMAAASKSRSSYEIFDHRKKPLPPALLRKSFTSGTKIDRGGETVTIVNELGRGVYGVVLLCTDEEGQNEAVKIQAPIGSLAHEYTLLLRVEDRVEPHASGFYPFPRAKALYAFSEGGLFSMTAGSDSGMTLIDVVNTYKRIMGNVPELVALYYSSRMLKHLESLHVDGKVAHADVKADNWVLTSSPKDRNLAGTNAVGGYDLMLVDFGRSIDLEKVASRGSDPLQTQFTGSVAAEDMECGSMRKGLPWGIDLDFFGLAASSFLLLFGSHVEVIEDRKTGKWRVAKPLRRYWQRELWESLFDSLLNFNASTGKYCLADIRSGFDEYIDGKQRKQEIASHLQHLKI